jgi:hypothetical protein
MMEDESDEQGTIGGVAECLIVDTRRTVPKGVGVNVDDEDAVTSEVLLHDVSPKAHGITTVYWIDEGESFSAKHGHGQMGFIRREQIPSSPGQVGKHFAVVPVTAKHNLRRTFDVKLKKWADAKSSSVWLRRNEPSDEVVLRFDNDLNWTPKETHKVALRSDNTSSWDFGIDVSCAHKLISRKNGATNESTSFELVRPDFKLKKGQGVGIAVYFDEAAAPTNKAISPDPSNLLKKTNQEIQDIYGKPFQTNVYTGKITFADSGQQHIEYTFNSFTGCSGAIVFLLDKQPTDSGVKTCDHGKAVAVHAGRHPRLQNRNFGFVLKEAMLSP